jgi:hypothetical protein
METKFMKSLFITTFILVSNFCLKAQDSNQEIPTELGKSPFTLLAVAPEKKAPARWLEDALEKYYKGKYIIIESNELYTTKYADRATYPYALLVFEGYIPGQFSADGRIPPSTSYSYGIRDLKTAKVYRWDSGRVNYKSMITDYIKAIEKLRKANSGE